MENIIPSSDLRNRYKTISKMCKETQKPIYITVNGRGDTVILDIETFQKMEKQIETYISLLKAEEDFRTGKTIPLDEAIEKLNKKYKFK